MSRTPTSTAVRDGPLAARLGRLAEDQRRAAIAPAGPVLCVAPAGSGKTTTVVARLAWRVSTGADPAAICALTFNRRAAEELSERADAALAELGLPAGSTRVRTFHALGREILRDGGVDVAAIVDRHDVLTKLSDGDLSEEGHRWLDEAFTRLKLDPERGPPRTDTQTHAAFQAYQRWLAREGAIDLDDLVAKAAPMLSEKDELLRRWRARCRVLFVDEAQDLDRAQLDLAVLLAGQQRDIFLVGDDDQTIYAWRLADVRRVLGLASRLPGLRRVDLDTNHRCAPEIVHRAARLVSHNRERFSKRIRASPTTAGDVTLAPDSGDEVARARRLLGTWAGAHSGERIAVLARTNRELAPYAAVALEMGLSYQVEDDGLLLEDAAILDTVSSARLAADEGLPLLAALRDAARRNGTAESTAGAMLAWAAAYRNLTDFETVLRQRIAERAARNDDGAGLTLATVHGTKGLEWDHVACIGFDDGAFPSGRALREASDPTRVLEEERRLAYVAWTRARRTLTIIYDPAAPSRFLREAFDATELV